MRGLLQSGRPLLLTAIAEQRENGYKPPSAPMNGEDDDSEERPVPRDIRLRAVSAQDLDEAARQCEASYSLDVCAAALQPSALEELKVILERHPGKADVRLCFDLDDVHCQMRLGQRWTIHPTFAFHQEVCRWRDAFA
jgi:hypothetical protein